MIIFIQTMLMLITFGQFSLYNITYVDRTIDTPIAELNNQTLREVFEGGNLWQPPITLQNLLLVGSVYVEQGQTNVVRLYKTGVTILNNNYYIRTELKRSLGGPNNIYIGANNAPSVNAIANTWTLLKSQLMPIDTTSVSFYSLNVTPNSGETFEYRLSYVINQTSLGISSLTVEQMDYWFNEYQELQEVSEHSYTYTINEVTLTDFMVVLSSAVIWFYVIKFLKEVF